MWCYLTGSQGRRIRIHRAAEFVFFEDQLGRLDLVCDFYVENISDTPECLRALHRGDVRPVDACKEWLDSRNCESRIARMTYGIKFNHEPNSTPLVQLDKLTFSLRPELGFEEVPVVPGSQKKLVSAVRSQPIPPGCRCLLRVRGSIEFQTLQELVDHRPQICIFGEWKLVQHLQAKLGEKAVAEPAAGSYLDFFARFCKHEWTSALKYDFFIDSGGRRLMAVTPDLNIGYDAREIAGRTVSWFWSTSSLAQASALHGGTSLMHRGSLLTVDWYKSSRRARLRSMLRPLAITSRPGLSEILADEQAPSDRAVNSETCPA